MRRFRLTHLIPPHWPRLCAIDFGTKNPAAVWGAWDRDADMMVIYDAWKGDGQTVYTTGQHADIVRSRGCGFRAPGRMTAGLGSWQRQRSLPQRCVTKA